MLEEKLTRAKETLLREQAITADKPGPILHDFQEILEFVGTKGVEVGGKYNLLPLKHIGELNARLSRPISLGLKRPQLRSHPYLQGLNLLLRASGLSRIEKNGAKGRLIVDPEMRVQWDRLNLTERYFNLLEAWLRIGRAGMVGEQESSWENLLYKCLIAWKHLPPEGRVFDSKKPHDVYIFGIGRDFYLLALMDLFGLLEVKQPVRPAAPWTPAAVGRFPFGDAVFTLLSELMFDKLREDEDEESEVPRLGVWQPRFSPYFPEWRENLEFPEPESHEGEFIFRVSVGKVWRVIAMPAEETLNDLLCMILRSFQFDSDHLYEFTYRDRMGARMKARHPECDDGPWADQVPIGTLPLNSGETMDLLFDFGDEWHFSIKLERIDPRGAKEKAKPARILERHGKAPEQYPSWDE